MPYKRTTKKLYKHTRNHQNKVAGVDKASALSRRFKQANPYRVKPEPFPRTLKTRMKFAENYSLAQSTVDSAVSKVFRANSIYDPDQSGVGRSTVAWSAMNGLYGRYLVTGCKIMIKFTNPASDGMRVGVRLRVAAGGATSGQSVRQLAEQPLTYMAGLNDTGIQTKTMSFFVRPWSLSGLNKLEYMANTSKYSSVMAGTCATDNCWFDVFAVDPQNASNNVQFTIKIVYYVTLYDRINQTSSAF